MIVLDTNVISEIMRPRPADAVYAWLRSFPAGSLYTTVINRAEVLYGVAVLDAGKRKRELVGAALRVFSEVFLDRVLALDDRAVDEFAAIAASRRRAGKPIQAMDALIAGIVRAGGFALATRDIDGFADCGIEIVNPWSA